MSGGVGSSSAQQGGQLGALKAVIWPHDHHRMEELLLGGTHLMHCHEEASIPRMALAALMP